ncbi:DNA methyltransferase [Natrononativus amylolyticus]|uniref:DNA methyltransferase n=1 Tax=Natrononativus amylolyticus TaxID=2963434 RepID=UPI0020CEE631|nr:DNA methyltransferase [Natrononativus amylolyticus]
MTSEPYYTAENGACYHGDSRELLEELPDESIDLVLTSPPFALTKKKEYGNKDTEEYNDWFMEFAEKIKRVLKPTGSFCHRYRR